MAPSDGQQTDGRPRSKQLRRHIHSLPFIHPSARPSVKQASIAVQADRQRPRRKPGGALLAAGCWLAVQRG